MGLLPSAVPTAVPTIAPTLVQAPVCLALTMIMSISCPGVVVGDGDIVIIS